MVHAGGGQLDRHFGAIAGGQLGSVQLQLVAEAERFAQDPPALVRIERARVAPGVAEGRQAAQAGDHVVDELADVLLGPHPVRDHVRAEERAHQLLFRLLGQAGVRPQERLLTLGREREAALGFQRRDSVPEEAAHALAAVLDQLVLGRRSRQPDGAHDAAAPVGLAPHPGRVLVSSRAGPDQVGAGVDEAGDDAGGRPVDDDGVRQRLHAPLPARAGPDPDDLAFEGGDSGRLQDPQRSLSLARLAGHQLAHAVDHQIRLDHARRID